MMMCAMVSGTSLAIIASVARVSVAGIFVITFVFPFMTVTPLPLTSVVVAAAAVVVVVNCVLTVTGLDRRVAESRKVRVVEHVMLVISGERKYRLRHYYFCIEFKLKKLNDSTS